jgi:hypothetical protein
MCIVLCHISGIAWDCISLSLSFSLSVFLSLYSLDGGGVVENKRGALSHPIGITVIYYYVFYLYIHIHIHIYVRAHARMFSSYLR